MNAYSSVFTGGQLATCVALWPKRCIDRLNKITLITQLMITECFQCRIAYLSLTTGTQCSVFVKCVCTLFCTDVSIPVISRTHILCN